MKIETKVGLFILASIGFFLYLSINIGAWRLDGSSFYTYKVYFEDTGGLERKSPVKIAGVTVGWVDDIVLTDNTLAELTVKVNRTHKLYRNSHVTIVQDGLIGSRTLEIDAGDSSSGILAPGSTLAMPGKTATSVADIIERFKEITDSVQDVVSSFQSVFATPAGERMIAKTLENAVNASKNLNEFSSSLDSVVKGNRDQIDKICSDLQLASSEIKTSVTGLKGQIEMITENAVEASTSVKKGGEKLDNTFKNTEKITQKVIDGDGTIGLLINDSSLFYDVKDTVSEVKNMVGKAGGMTSTIDTNIANYYQALLPEFPRSRKPSNTRGFCEIQIAMHSDYFYCLQISSDNVGKLSRNITYSKYYDESGASIDTMDPSVTPYQRARLNVCKEELIRRPGEMLLGFQLCKKYKDLTLRGGIFEGTFGVGCDYDFGLRFKHFRWQLKLEAFDFSGYNRIEEDSRPHVRVSNKFFLMKNIYTFVGFDDIFSKRQASVFWGAGLTFDDDDIKYLLSVLPVGKLVAG